MSLTDQCRQIVELAKKATPRPWKWWTSNSTRRLGSADRDGNVAFGQNQRDGYGDIAISERDMVYSEAACSAAPDMAATILAIEGFAREYQAAAWARDVLKILERTP